MGTWVGGRVMLTCYSPRPIASHAVLYAVRRRHGIFPHIPCQRLLCLDMPNLALWLGIAPPLKSCSTPRLEGTPFQTHPLS